MGAMRTGRNRRAGIEMTEQRRTTSGMLPPDAGGALVLTFALPVSRLARKAEVSPKIEECYRETARAFV